VNNSVNKNFQPQLQLSCHRHLPQYSFDPPPMKQLSWVRFQWDLSAFPANGSPLPPRYQIAPAVDHDVAELRKLFSTAFVLDSTWNAAIDEVLATVQTWLDRAFASRTSICLALRHGTRIIGASVVVGDPEADHHLTPGPCILIEYRNRGFGTHLLRSSLRLLREQSFSRAVAITRQNSIVARYLYPKFGGVAVPIDFPNLLAA
jgi:GNAT superfamily N-acetyltransferase